MRLSNADGGRRFMTIFALGLFASPAASFWAASRQRKSGPWPWLRWAFAGAFLLAAIVLLRAPLRWQIAATAWGAVGIALSALVAVLVPALSEDGNALEPEETHPWANTAIRSVVPLIFIIPSMLALTRLLSWLILGDVLVRLNARAVDPQEAFALLFVDMFWIIPFGIVFVARSCRLGRLRDSHDLARAFFAWLFVLLLRDLVVHGGFGALKSQLLNAPGFSEWGNGAAVVIYLALIGAIAPLCLYLAWGRERWFVRLAATTAIVLAGFVNLGTLVGGNALVQFVAARAAERSGQVESSLRWYERSLRSSASPTLAPYLHHRIGLLRYKKDDVSGARDSLRLLVTAGEAGSDLHRQGSYFLERLAGSSGGSRVVLPGVEVQSERRQSYCAPNTLSLVFGFLGRDVGVAELAEEVTVLGAGTQLSDIRRVTERLGLDHYLVAHATLSDVRWLIDQGLPALIYTPGHVLAGLGYDEYLGTMVSYDTAKWDIWVDRPYSEVEEDWGQSQFLLGVVVPRDDTPSVAAVRERFDTPWATATWQWWLSQESYSHRSGHLEQAIINDPTFFPAVFALLETAHEEGSTRDRIQWLRERADMPQVIAKAHEALERPFVDRGSMAYGLALWYSITDDPEPLLELASSLARFGQEGLAQPMAGVAAAKLERWEQAAFMLADETDSDYASIDALESLVEAYLNLGQERAALEAVRVLAEVAWDDRLERALAIAESVSEGEGAAYLESVYANYVYSRPEDVDGYLLLAESTLSALEEDPSTREERLTSARSAATLARALARTDEQRSHGEELLARVGAMAGGSVGR